MPRPTRTEFFTEVGERAAIGKWMTPDVVVRAALPGLDRDRAYVVPGLGNAAMAHLSPRRPRRLVTAIAKRVARRVPAHPGRRLKLARAVFRLIRAGLAGPRSLCGSPNREFLKRAARLGLVALAHRTMIVRRRRLTPTASRLGGLLLLLAGGYVAYDGWWEIRVLGGGAMADPVIDAASAVKR